MSTRRGTFGWEREDVAAPEPDETGPGRPERREHREAMRDLKDLANRLSNLAPGLRRTLPLSEETLDALDALQRADGEVHRRRELMRAKRLLNGEDVAKVEAALAGDTPAVARERELVAWRARLLAGGDAAIQAFMEHWPGADRQALRAAVRAAKAGPQDAAAATRLLKVLREGSGTVGDDG